MAVSVRRLRSLRSSLSSLASRTHVALRSSVFGSTCGLQPECSNQLISARHSYCRESGVLGLDSGDFSGGVGCHWSVRDQFIYPKRLGYSGDVVAGARGFAAKAKKSGGKARSDDGGGQMLATPGPSAKETASRLMEAALNALSAELSKLRTGRASPGMLDHVNVTSHGVQTPLSHVAAVSVSSLETLTVMPYDASMVKEVEKAVRNSPLKLNPVAEGEVLRVPIPKLTKEHIQTMSKLVGKAGETAKLSLRRARKDAMDIIGKGGFSKDEVKRYEKEVEDVTKKYVKSVEEACKLKEKEILGNS